MTEKTPKQTAEENAVPIKDVLADEEHPLHNMVKEFIDKLERGEIHLS